MTITATRGSISISEEAARLSLATCAEWQSMTGTANPTAALASIHEDVLLPEAAGAEYTVAELQGLRPFAIVATASVDGYRLIGDSFGTSRGFYGEGDIVVYIETDVLAAHLADPAEAIRLFKNSFGVIIDQLRDLAGATGGFLDSMGVRSAASPYRNHPNRYSSEGPIFSAEIALSWRGSA
jgi:hypothetical protein